MIAVCEQATSHRCTDVRRRRRVTAAADVKYFSFLISGVHNSQSTRMHCTCIALSGERHTRVLRSAPMAMARQASVHRALARVQRVAIVEMHRACSAFCRDCSYTTGMGVSVRLACLAVRQREPAVRTGGMHCDEWRMQLLHGAVCLFGCAPGTLTGPKCSVM